MNEALTPIEVLDIAQQIERNGVAFYQKAVELFDKPTPRAIFRTLALRETEHEKIFAEMKERLFGRGIPAADETKEDGSVSPASMAGLAVFGISKNPAEQLTGKETVAEIIRVAIENEKNSVVFYTGLKDFIADDMSSRTIAGVIQEEMRHIRILTESLEQYD
jgi:rubrerythrin